MDRNYPSYRMLGELIDRERHFVIRCSNASFGPAREMLKGEGPLSIPVNHGRTTHSHTSYRTTRPRKPAQDRKKETKPP